MARGTFNGPIDATFLPRRHWQLNEPLSFKSEEITKDEIDFLRKHCDYVDEDGTITAKKGTVTDLASIPRVAWTFIAPFEVARAAANVADPAIPSDASIIGKVEKVHIDR